MSFGAGMGAGIATGVGAGMAIGVASGRKRVCEELREKIALQGMTISDRQGQAVDIERLLDEVEPTRSCAKEQQSKWLVALLIVGTGILAALILTFAIIR